MWKVEKPIYGLPESGVQLFGTYAQHNVKKLGMTATEVEQCLLYRSDKQGNLDGISCLQVDDTITAGSSNFCEDGEEASKSFKSTGKNYIKDSSTSKFNRQHICRRGKEILIHQKTTIGRVPGTRITQNKASFMSEGTTEKGSEKYAGYETAVGGEVYVD